MKTAKTRQKKGKELDNKFFAYSNYSTKGIAKEMASDMEKYFRRKHPDDIVEKHPNKQGIKVVVYEKSDY